ncbi:MAG: PAS domain S-box protein [Candidatus Desulfatibia sp.]|uniref:PAS domain S-box protein n=1 Tax=Candidatus Desulfatibia sp. TaxID=3101189 RepID=UPI002F2D3E39
MYKLRHCLKCDVEHNFLPPILMTILSFKEQFMVGKPTYKELHQRVRALEQEIIESKCAFARDLSERKKAEEALRRSEQHYRAIFKQAADSVLIIDLQTGKLHAFNDRAHQILGYSRQEFAKLKVSDIESVEPGVPACMNAEQVLKEHTGMFETKHKTKEGQVRDMLVSCRVITIHGENYLQCICRDITERNKAEQALQKAKDQLESRTKLQTRELETKTRHFEELNVTLNVLLQQREADKKALEENILSNMKKLIVPVLNRLKNFSLNARQKEYLGLLESNLNEIISPFAYKLSSKFVNLTAAEMQVADFVKQGMSTKEIARLLSVSVKTINTHRGNIRRKIGINNKKTNLKFHLSSRL